MNSAPPLNHLAIIMDGNGRWAAERGLERIAGHQAGSRAVRATAEACHELGIRYLTLFSFSTENWGRPTSEVTALMKLFREHLDRELPEMLKAGIRLRAVGDLDRLPFFVRSALHRNIEQTKDQGALDLILAVSYGGREEIVAAARELAGRAARGKLKPEDINADTFSSCLWTKDIPDPDLLIRTSGEMRISNFLLWQLAYSEIIVTPEYWPEFNKDVLQRCITEYQARERRFGLTSEQLSANGAAAVRPNDAADAKAEGDEQALEGNIPAFGRS